LHNNIYFIGKGKMLKINYKRSMQMKKNGIVVFFEIITMIIILVILGILSIAVIEIFDIVEIPEKYSVLKYIPATVEVSIKEYDQGNVITNTVKKDNNIKNIIQIDSSNNETVKVNLDNLSSNENNNTNNNINKYYYSLLNEYGKTIYNKILNNLENLKTGTYKIEFKNTFDELLEQENGAEILENAFQAALNAFIYDNPEVFYLDISQMYLHTETKKVIIKKTSNVYIAPKEGENYLNKSFGSKEEIDNAIEEIRQIVQNIESECSDKSQYTKIKSVHNYLIDNLEYDSTISNENIYNIYGALINKLTVCEGYTKAFKYILDELEIENIFVFGTGINKNGERESHSWNYVKLEGKWYAVDVTWDDPILIGGGYLTNEFRYRYFLKGANDFEKDHIATGKIIDNVEFIYPDLNYSNYQ